MLFDTDLVTLADQGKVTSATTTPKIQTVDKKRGRICDITNAPSPGIDPETWYDRKLTVCLLNEGLRFLDGMQFFCYLDPRIVLMLAFPLLIELVHTPKTETAFGLIYVVRSLRVFTEMEGSQFFSTMKG